MTPETIPWPITANWLLGLTGALAVSYLALEVTSHCRKLFGKKESTNVTDDLKRLAADCERRHEILRGEMDERFREFTIERARSLADLYEKINRVAEDVAYIRGKMSND
jgi:hypothetical protein